MRERIGGKGLLAAAAAVFGICCGFPVLGTLGTLGLLVGLSTTSWLLIALGAVTAVLGGWTLLGRRRRARVESASSPRARHPGDSRRRVGAASETPTLTKEH